MGLRLFVAIALPDAVRALLAGAAARLSLAPDPVKWVEAASLHLTVKFLGDADPAQVEPIRAALERSASGVAPFEMRIRGAGAFPGPKRPRVVWAGLEAPPALASLVEAVEREVSPLGFPREVRPWSPHVTLGRVKHERGGGRRRPSSAASQAPDLAALLQRERALASEPFPVEAVTLFESVLGHRGPVYTERVKAALRGSSP